MAEKRLVKSKKYFSEAKKLIPGGVNSPVRAFKAIGIPPVFMEKAKGAYVYDVDGNKYIDYVLSWGPMILGHADPRVTKAVCAAVKKGASFGAPTKRETELARLITEIFPSIEKVRLTSSGTEAAMSAVRLAAGFSGKEKIIKFKGCYHGHFDRLLDGAVNTITLPFNDLEKFAETVKREKDNLGCVIVEPIPANMGVVLPKPGFLEGLRRITRENNIILIFDEVITGLRVALGGAQELFKIKPDMAVLGKIIGGGLPLAAFGGRKEIMDYLAPDGPVYQAGTLSGNPAATAAGIATIKALTQKGIYGKLEKKAAILEAGLKEASRKDYLQVTINRAGSMFTIFFTDKPVNNYEDAAASDLSRFAAFFKGMLGRGIYLTPSQFEANFISLKHTSADIAKTVNCFTVKNFT